MAGLVSLRDAVGELVRDKDVVSMRKRRSCITLVALVAPVAPTSSSCTWGRPCVTA